MVTTFCLRLACGLTASLVVLSPAQVQPKFYRVQFLSALGLLATAAFFRPPSTDTWSLVALAGGMAICLFGSIVWHLDNAPGGTIAVYAAAAILTTALLLGGIAAHGDESRGSSVLDDLASAAVLGSATTAMLMGHSYLIAPAMSLSPLYRLLGALGVSLLLRSALAAAGLWMWTRRPSTGSLETEMLLWLSVRWMLGLVLPLVLGWMAWETARIRSTQSATGILYVVVIVVFLGELTSQLLLEKTSYIL
ncbi:MAG: hypothetical protein HY040_10015 [Planctomycetes bacterium]|nr:hypothetical protein [Planctomycetota bacterium]